MVGLSQKNRFLQLTSKLGAEVLIPLRFSGKESLSRLFSYKLMVISSNVNIKPADLLETPVILEIAQSPKPRYFHGLVRKFRAGKVEGKMRRYEITLTPWLGMLEYEKNYRIFKNRTVKDILTQVFEEHGFFDFQFSKMQIKHEVREYCTQYDETTLHFVQRLLEEEGMFYFFEHSKDKHKMIIADDFSIHTPCPNSEIIYTGENERGTQHYIDSWERGYQMYAGQYMHTDSNYKASTKKLQTKNERTAQLPQSRAYTIHDYPGGYSEADNGRALANYRAETQESQYNIVNGSGNHLEFFAGSQFKLSKHPEPSEIEQYNLFEVVHKAWDNSYLSGTGAAGGETQHYSNTFRCVQRATNYRPPRVTEKPKAGVQTGFVVGPEGEEISTDEYGRVQVRFHWIRKEGKHIGDKSSRWVRVAQAWGGKGYGAWFLPRIRQEVVIQFLNDDPDQPLIVGCVYNDDLRLPFPLPGNKTQSGIRTESSKNKNGANILRFEDKAGDEEIFIEAEKDFNQHIKNDMTITVDNDSTEHIKHDLKNTVDNDFTELVKHDFVLTIDNDSTEHIKHNLSTTVDNNYTQVTERDENYTVGNDRKETIKNNLQIHVGKNALVKASDSITLKVGNSAIQITAGEIILHSPHVLCNDKKIGGYE